ncbi:histidinol dehydrogenase [Enemella dayhoffiae]|uniref:Histidinol dehydrogenase n=1 Tax=Enemella dayhoffiae TaxID=2016507 RepID=A0A255H973_9ACTN|nr:histidinol dehydrogenase [Enemella dayhoffiae]
MRRCRARRLRTIALVPETESNTTRPAEALLRVIDLRGHRAGSGAELSKVVPRAAFDVEQAMAAVRPVVEAVATRGEEALRELSERFDKVVPDSFRVPVERLAAAEKQLDAQVREAFELAIERRRQVSLAELGDTSVAVDVDRGARVIQKLIPVNRVGLYVPGGLAPLASSVIMNVVPAQVAGVGSIAVTSPPQVEFGGEPHPNILALCSILGIDEVYAVGGAQAVAMFAHGVPGLCEPVDLVTGPGNIYVVAAKRLLKGKIGIDSEAGPTEIAILADDSANPAHVAADLISQAEHDPLAGSVLVTDSAELAAAVEAQLEPQLGRTRHVERIRTALTGEQSGVVLVDDLEQGLAVVDAYAAEHLEIHTHNAFDLAQRVTNAGAIFIGGYSPVSLGDYCAGSTHVLPTAGAAKHSSGLNVKSFLREVHLIHYDRGALAEVRREVETFAEAEQLPAHGAAISVRFDEEAD